MVEHVRVRDLVDATVRLVQQESWGGRESGAQRLVASVMQDAGLSVDTWPLDLGALQAHPACSWELDRKEALGVVGSIGSGRGPTLVLNGHVDVVPPGDDALWTHPPFAGAVEGGRVHGRGALDVKGPLMAGLFALAAIRRAGIELEGTARLQSVVGEEDGGIGTLGAILRYGPADGAVVMEPTELAVVPLQAGCLSFRVRVPGLAAHGAVREEGVSAIDNAWHVLEALRGLEERRNRFPRPDPLFARYRIPFPISVGTISGGDWASSVPDHVTFEGRMGVRPDEPPESARTDLEQAVVDAAERDPWLRHNPPTVTWWGGRFLPAATPPDHPLPRTLEDALSSVTGEPTRVEGVPFGADAGLLATVGETPTVLFGAGDIRDAHRPNESIDCEQLATMAAALAVLVVRFCGTVGDDARSKLRLL